MINLFTQKHVLYNIVARYFTLPMYVMSHEYLFLGQGTPIVIVRDHFCNFTVPVLSPYILINYPLVN